MKIVVGLGNFGKEYEKTRHNIGFMFLEYLENKYNFKINKNKGNCLIGEKVFNGEKVIFVKPLTYMNLSGNAVKYITTYYKSDINNIIIIFDDIDIPFEDIRYKINGSGGTHNGMKNIVEVMQTKDIKRIKIGIGNIKPEGQDLASFVLQRFNREQLDKIDTIFDKVDIKLKEFLGK